MHDNVSLGYSGTDVSRERCQADVQVGNDYWCIRVTNGQAAKDSPAIVDADANGSWLFPRKFMLAKELANLY
jgi:hypothetical protein